MKTNPHISVCMPMYNASRYLRECIDSVLGQTFHDFEFLIVDDGSTDDSVEIVESYADPRIRLIRREHDYIASLNCLIDEARGEYIARMDADDVMLPNRLQLQFDYMESHPDIDVLGAAAVVICADEPCGIVCGPDIIGIHDMINECPLVHPTIIIRAWIIKANKYSEDYQYAEDYELWFRLYRQGYVIRNISDVVLKYRQSKSQISSIYAARQKNLSEILRLQMCKYAVSTEMDAIDHICDSTKSGRKLTVVIPFLNEREEVINTVCNIRETAGDLVEIIVINDTSTPDFPYEESLSVFDVRYYVNEIRLGAALSKEKGVMLTSTPYFLIIDAHMRFHTSQWYPILMRYLEENSDRLLCCDTVPLIKTSNGNVVISEQMVPCKAAYLTFREEMLLPGIQWNTRKSRQIPGLMNNQICAVLGACYASSKQYWSKITGMRGLLHFGCEEACISLKSWLMGGGCTFIPEIELGHIYRTKQVYSVSTNAFVYNYMAICDMLMPTADKCLSHAIAQRSHKEHYQTAMYLISSNKVVLNEIAKLYADNLAGKFSRIVDQNILTSYMQNIDEFDILNFEKRVINYILECNDNTYGLLNGGIVGQLLYILSYINGFKVVDDEYCSRATELFVSVENELMSNHRLGYSMYDGYAGIGWALLYIASHDLIDDDVTALLDIIDERISEYSPLRIKDHSFANGLGGIYCYVVNRKNFCEKKCIKHNLPESFIHELQSLQENMIATDNDYRSCTYAMQFIKSFSTSDYAFYTMRPMDIVKPNRFVPCDDKLWKYDYANILGYAFEITYIQQLIHQYEKE